jgi:hypothetical protein
VDRIAESVEMPKVPINCPNPINVSQQFDLGH